ncbi:MAG: pseudouridine synthase [Bacteroidales bacterium]
MTTRPRGAVSLARALSKLGLASRAEATVLVRDGRVRVDGRVVRNAEFPVVPERAHIAIDGRSAARPPSLTILLHKPRGVVVTRHDPEGRPTVLDLVSGSQGRVMPVGRLDLATSGLLLLTNDSRFAAWITDPANAVVRTYAVTAKGEVGDQALERLRSGVLEGGTLLRAAAIELRKRSGRETHLLVELLEGKNREIRRLFRAVGHDVTRLKRVAFGGLTLGDLPAGKWRELSAEELRRAFPGAPLRTRERASAPGRLEF